MEQCDRRVLSFFEVCDSNPDSVATLEASFRSALEQMGFRYYACCSHVDPLEHTSDAVMLQNYPGAWVQRFSDAKLHRIDPVLKHSLILAARGKTNWEIGRLLSLSEHTVHSYFKGIKRRFGVYTRVQAVVAALMAGEISLDDIAHESL